MAPLTSATSSKSLRPTLPDSPSATSSPASADGHSPSNSPDGLPTDLFGRAVAHASPSLPPGSKRARMMSGTSGLPCSDSLKTADHRSSSESKSTQQRSPADREWRRRYALEDRKKNRAYHLIRHARERAKKKGLAFDLDSYILNVQDRIDHGLCEVTGLPLNLDGGRTWDSPSIDRIDPKGPYLYANIRVVSLAINSAMGDWGEQKLVQLALAILAQRKARSNAFSRRLGERLIQNLEGHGSSLFSLIWSEQTTRSGRSYYRLRASARSTDDSASGSWPTPMAGTPSTEDYNAAGKVDALLGTLETPNGPKGAWPTTTVQDAIGSRRHGYMDDGRPRAAVKQQKDSLTGHSGTTLTDAANLASWATPTTRDHKDGAFTQNVPENALLGRQVWQASWPTPMTVPDSEASHGQLSGTMRKQLEKCAPIFGPMPSGFPAATASGGQLNPSLSRFLMGYPKAWDWCAMAIPASTVRSSKKPKPELGG